MQEIILKISYFERGLPKSLKKLFFFRTVSFDWQSWQKQKKSGTSHQSLLRSWNKFRKIPLFVVYHLTKFDNVMWNSFWVIPKTICKFMKVNLWHHELSHFHLSFILLNLESVERQGKITKIWISREWKEFFRWNKKQFSSFLNGYHLVKNWKFDKNSRHKL